MVGGGPECDRSNVHGLQSGNKYKNDTETAIEGTCTLLLVCFAPQARNIQTLVSAEKDMKSGGTPCDDVTTALESGGRGLCDA